MEEEKEASGLFLEHRIVREAFRIFFWREPWCKYADFTFFEVREARGVGIDQEERGKGGSRVEVHSRREVELCSSKGGEGESFNTLLDNL